MKRYLWIYILSSFFFVNLAVADSITLNGTLRDFYDWSKDQSKNPDFEHTCSFIGNPAGCKNYPPPSRYGKYSVTGLVKERLDKDKKPVLKNSGVGLIVANVEHKSITSETSFAQWFSDVPTINKSIPYEIELKKIGDVYTYTNNSFFPLDGRGFGNEGRVHNYHFTYEIHSSFTYLGSESFTFSGDDDVWVFINGELVVDIGGVHSSVTRSVDLDDLGLVKGNTYDFDFFFAERHVSGSNFTITTSIKLENNTQPSLYAEYRFDECFWNGTYGEVIDSSGNGYNATALEGDVWNQSTTVELDQDGLINSSGKFADGLVRVDGMDNFPKDNFSVSVWAKINGEAIGYGNWHTLVMKEGNFKDVNGVYKLKYDHKDKMIQVNGLTRMRVEYDLLDDKWHHIVTTFKDGTLKIYADGNLLGVEENLHMDQGNDILNIGGDNHKDGNGNSGYQSNSNIDEVKIYKGELDENMVKKIFENEKLKKNYDGSVRDSVVCKNSNNNSLLNATDETKVFDWDKNISTKIVNKPFALTVHAKDKDAINSLSGANIVKLDLMNCDGTPEKSTWWSGDKTTSSSGIVSIENLIYDKAIPCAYVKIYSDSSDGNSTDKFAIRPDRYLISPLPTTKAGDKFDINITALDFNGAKVTNYSANQSTYKIVHKESNSSCSTGDLTHNKADFIAGEANIANATYNDVGKLNISVSDINGSEFAQIDIGDPNRFISSNSKDFDFSVGDFNLSWSFADAGDKITYYSNTPNSMGAKLTIDITAVDTNGNQATNFKKGCYAKDVTAKITYDINTSSTLKMLVRGEKETDINIASSGVNQNFIYTIEADTFVTSHKNEPIKINFTRNQTKAIEPTHLQITDVNVSSGTTFTHSAKPNQEATFYFARAHAPDYVTVGKNFDATIFYEVYCKSCDKTTYPLANGIESKDSIYWYILQETIYDPLNSNFDNIKPMGTKNDNDTIKLQAPKLPYKVTIKYDPQTWLIYNMVSNSNKTHRFNVRFNPSDVKWIGKGDIGLTVDTNISTQTNSKMSW